MYVKKKSTNKYTRRYRKTKKSVKPIVSLLKRAGAYPIAKYSDYGPDRFTIGTPSQVGSGSISGYTPYSVYNLNIARISHGTQVDDRTSNVITLKKLDIRMVLQPTYQTDSSFANSNIAPYNLRIMVVQDTQTISDANQLGGVSGTSTSPNGSLSLLLQHQNSDYIAISSHLNITSQRGRFKVLWDKVFRFNSSAQAGGLGNVNNLKDKIIRKALYPNLKIYFNGDNPSDIQKNAIYLIMFTDNQVSGLYPLCCDLIVRQKFHNNTY